VITSVSEGTPQDVDLAVDAAQKAFETTYGLNCPGSQRSILIGKLASLMEKHADELAAIEALDNGMWILIGCNLVHIRCNGHFFTAGKAFNMARNIDVAGSIECLRYYAGWADKISGNVLEVDSLSVTIIVYLV